VLKKPVTFQTHSKFYYASAIPRANWSAISPFLGGRGIFLGGTQKAQKRLVDFQVENRESLSILCLSLLFSKLLGRLSPAQLQSFRGNFATVFLRVEERWGAGVEYHFQEIS